MNPYKLFFCAVISAAFFLNGCGFKPLYNSKGEETRQTIISKTADFDIAVIPNQDGQFLRNLLIDRFYTKGYPQNPRYRLLVSPITETEQSLAIAKSSESTRSQLRQVTRMELQDRQTGTVVLVRDLMAISSYNILVSEFATGVTGDNARQNGLSDLARQIALHLGLYFNR